MNFAHIRRAVLSVAIIACCTAAAAAAIAGGIADRAGAILKWTCVQQYDPLFNVRCTPHIDGTVPGAFPLRWAALFWEDILGQPPVAWRAVGVVSRAPDTRPVAMRHSDEIFSGEAWYVPLHSRPTDAANVVRVLQAVLCGTMSHCRVTYGPGGRRRDSEE